MRQEFDRNDQTRLAEELYLYGYPVVGMYELLWDQCVNPATKSAGLNTFAHTAALATPETTFIPAPNNDTTYSRAWLDLRGGPVVIDMPDTNGRYYSIQFLNLFSETLENVGRRTTGTGAVSFAVAGPDWAGELPEGCHVVRSDSTFALAFLRVLIGWEEELETVRELQASVHVRALGAGTESPLPICKTESCATFLRTLGQILDLTPALEGEGGLRQALDRALTLPDDVLEVGRTAAQARIEAGGQSFGEEVNHWRVARTGIGHYGSDYLQRAVVWHKGALANCPEESLYPSTFQDSDGQLLDGRHVYRLTFAPGGLPPVSQFWSLTIYRFHDALLCENPIRRYALGDRTEELIYGDDGSLSIAICHAPPEDPVARANWLPAPEGRFFLSLRLYGPHRSAIEGTWAPPGVERLLKGA